MIQQLADVEPFETDRFIGKVTHVSASMVRVNLGATNNGVSDSWQANNIVIGQLVIVDCEEFSLLGKVSQIRTTPTNVFERNPSVAPHSSSPVATVELLASIDSELGTLVQGLVCSPRIEDKVFIANPKLVQLLISPQDHQEEGHRPMLVSFARLARGEDTALSFTPEMLFGRHCAILGTTGGGKSWSVARMVEEVAQFRSKVILFDPSGEYSSLERHTKHVYLGEDPEPKRHWQQVTLPYFELTEGDLFSIFRPTGQSQGPKLRAAIQSLKLAHVSPDLAPDGTIIKAHKYKAHYDAEYAAFSREIERPNARFDITRLSRQIENECVNPYRSPVEPGIWGDSNRADYAACMPLLNRIHDITESPNLACIFQPRNKRSLLTEIDSFLNDDAYRVLRISLKHVPFLHSAREIIANALGRYLTELAREGRFKSMPLLTVLDESHHFLNKAFEETNNPLDAFATIAKEGRKYGLTILLATQRPRDIPEGVLSQMGTMVIHRLINNQDRSVVERACGELDHSTMQTIPSLTPGEAVILGVDFPTPLVVKVERPTFEPISHGPDYQQFWK